MKAHAYFLTSLALVTRHLIIRNKLFSFIAIFICVLCGCSRSASEAENILGCPLPASATDIHIAHQQTIFVHEDLLSMAMSHDDFVALMAHRGLKHHLDTMLAAWPTALGGLASIPQHHLAKIPWWTVTRTNDADTYFDSLAESPYSNNPLGIDETNIAARYESGRLFFQRHIFIPPRH